jgi:hypothetical protein
MLYYVGLDVSVKETSVCIVDNAGKVMRGVKVATKPVAILAVLTEEGLAIERIGLEAGPLSQWLYSALAEAEGPAETRGKNGASFAQWAIRVEVSAGDKLKPLWLERLLIGRQRQICEDDCIVRRDDHQQRRRRDARHPSAWLIHARQSQEAIWLGQVPRP